MNDKDLTNKFKFYQDIRLWPKNSDHDYEGWLDNLELCGNRGKVCDHGTFTGIF
jgi:hypothetical protein